MALQRAVSASCALGGPGQETWFDQPVHHQVQSTSRRLRPSAILRTGRSVAGAALITHTLLFKSELPDTPSQEVIVWDTRYAPGALNPRHLHPAAITFHVLSGTGVWQEDGKAPITLHAGDSLFVAAGTIHSH